VNLQSGTATGRVEVFDDGAARVEPFSHTLTSMENVWGSNRARDLLTGDDGPNDLFGLARNDQLSGAGGDDFLNGGRGTSDSLNGGDGTDTCVNGETNDASCETVQANRFRVARRMFAGGFRSIQLRFLRLVR
jgi:Ca2+-binding RTX toxin-like protein